MQLLRKDSMFRDVHRAGWPYVWDELHKREDGTGTWLDDFADGTFLYLPRSNHVYTEPWVGFFHHPAVIKSPLPSDQGHCIKTVGTVPGFSRSLPHLKGAIALCPEVAHCLREWLKIPTLCLKHPTDMNVPQWQRPDYLWQVGFFLRDLRFIYRLTTNRECFRSKPWIEWQISRDRQLQRRTSKSRNQSPVTELERLDNEQYDEMMQRSVVCMYLHGAAANNVVIECIARATPLLVNHLSAVEYYLGKDYPLFYKSVAEANELLKDDRTIYAAHKYLVGLQRHMPNVEAFADRVLSFTEGCTR